MKIVVGLDIGGSTTKIVCMRGKEIVASEIVRAGDPVTSAFGAVGKLISATHIGRILGSSKSYLWLCF